MEKRTFRFAANDSSGKKYVIEIESMFFACARDMAQKLCYKAGLCFKGRESA